MRARERRKIETAIEDLVNEWVSNQGVSIFHGRVRVAIFGGLSHSIGDYSTK